MHPADRLTHALHQIGGMAALASQVLPVPEGLRQPLQGAEGDGEEVGPLVGGAHGGQDDLAAEAVEPVHGLLR